MTDLIPVNSQLLAEDGDLYDTAITATLHTVSEASQRTYQHAYDRWGDWCHNNGLSPLAFKHIRAFLLDQAVSYQTRKTMLSAIRQLVTTIEIIQPGEARWAAYNRLLQRLRAPKEGCVTNEQLKVALTPEQAWRVLSCWVELDKNTSERDAALNHALVCTAVLSGLRRAELLALAWRDIDLVRGVITVRHGKGDKHREAALFGSQAHQALAAWHVLSATDPVFPVSESTAWRVFKRTAAKCGLEKFSPHDARRTLLTEMLATGTPLHETQEQAGHERGDTTLLYAQAADAEKRKEDAKLRFGG